MSNETEENRQIFRARPNPSGCELCQNGRWHVDCEEDAGLTDLEIQEKYCMCRRCRRKRGEDMGELVYRDWWDCNKSD